jgi:hypothetical protein
VSLFTDEVTRVRPSAPHLGSRCFSFLQIKGRALQAGLYYAHVWSRRLSSDYSEIKTHLEFDANAPAPNFERDWNLPTTGRARSAPADAARLSLDRW